MLDSILVANEVVEESRRSKKSVIVVKVGYKKSTT